MMALSLQITVRIFSVHSTKNVPIESVSCGSDRSALCLDKKRFITRQDDIVKQCTMLDRFVRI